MSIFMTLILISFDWIKNTSVLDMLFFSSISCHNLKVEFSFFLTPSGDRMFLEFPRTEIFVPWNTGDILDGPCWIGEAFYSILDFDLTEAYSCIRSLKNIDIPRFSIRTRYDIAMLEYSMSRYCGHVMSLSYLFDERKCERWRDIHIIFYISFISILIQEFFFDRDLCPRLIFIRIKYMADTYFDCLLRLDHIELLICLRMKLRILSAIKYTFYTCVKLRDDDSCPSWSELSLSKNLKFLG